MTSGGRPINYDGFFSDAVATIRVAGQPAGFVSVNPIGDSGNVLCGSDAKVCPELPGNEN